MFPVLKKYVATVAALAGLLSSVLVLAGAPMAAVIVGLIPNVLTLIGERRKWFGGYGKNGNKPADRFRRH